MRNLRSFVLPLGAAALLAASSLPAWSQSAGSSGSTGGPASLDPDHSAVYPASPLQMPPTVDLDKLQKQMKIQPDQQTAWDNYVNATNTLFESPSAQVSPGDETSAMTSVEAQHQQDKAEKVQAWASATDQLNQVSTMNQRVVLNRATQEIRNAID